MPFKSQAQQKFAFANKMPWAKEWAHKTGEGGGTKKSKRAYAALPQKVKARGKKRATTRRKRRS